LICNFCSNLYLLEKQYPDGALSNNYLGIFALLLFFAGLVVTFLTIAYTFVLYDIFLAPATDPIYIDRTRVFVLMLGTILLIAYYVLWMQVALKRIIRRNHARIYTAFLQPDEKV
jgi:hypothetical protein